VGSIPDGVIRIFHCHNTWGVKSAVQRADRLASFMYRLSGVWESQPHGTLSVCTGIALPIHIYNTVQNEYTDDYRSSVYKCEAIVIKLYYN
jgi:hypothetical protein